MANGMLLPLATIEDVREMLADTERDLDRLGHGVIVDVDRFNERREILKSWTARLRAQLDQMEAAAG